MPKASTPLAFEAFTRIVPAFLEMRSVSSASEGTISPPTKNMSGTRRTRTSRSGTQFTAPRPDAASDSIGNGGTAPWKLGRNSAAGSPACAKAAFGAGKGRGMSLTRTSPTTLWFLSNAVASARSLERPSSIGARAVFSGPSGRRSRIRSGDDRSGSASTMSSAMVDAPRSPSFVTAAASRSRGHGHWPKRLRDSSSISMTLTGIEGSYGRGAIRWKASNTTSRAELTDGPLQTTRGTAANTGRIKNEASRKPRNEKRIGAGPCRAAEEFRAKTVKQTIYNNQLKGTKAGSVLPLCWPLALADGSREPSFHARDDRRSRTVLEAAFLPTYVLRL